MRLRFERINREYASYGLYAIAISVIVIVASLAVSSWGPNNLIRYPLLHKSMFIQVSVWLIATVWVLHLGFFRGGKAIAFKRSPFDAPLILLFGWGALSLIWAEMSEHTLVGLLRWSAVGLMMLVAYQTIRSEKDIRLVLGALFTAGVIVSVIGILQMLTDFDYIAQVVKSASTSYGPSMRMTPNGKP